MKKEKTSSKELKTTLILFWIIVAIFAAFFFLAPKWETYVHPHFGFQFKYPSRYEIQEHKFFNGLSVKVIDPTVDTIYLDILIFGLRESAVETQVPDNPHFSGPYPRKIPANEKNGELTVVEKNFNNIKGVEVFGSVVEGRDYMDAFQFRDKDYEWSISLNPVGEGRIQTMPWDSPAEPYVFDKNVYLKIRDSFSLVKSI